MKANEIKPQGHRLMNADVDGGPCLFCAACGAYCTVKPKHLLDKCPGKAARQAGGLAALKRFRAGYAPTCGELIGRKVHGVQPLHRSRSHGAVRCLRWPPAML